MTATDEKAVPAKGYYVWFDHEYSDLVFRRKEDRMKKLMMVISVLLLLYFFLNPALALSTETKEIVAEGTYIMGDGETPIIAEGRAVEQAKRYAVEQAGTYVKSYSRVK